MSDVSIFITEEAERTMGDMRRRVAEIGAQYGRGSEEHLKAMQSLLDCFLTVLRFGGRVYKDSELNLLIVSWITIGIIFHPAYVDGKPHPLLGDWSSHS